MKELLTDDHLELDELFNRLLDALDNGTVAEVHEHLDLFWARLAMHIRAENLHLFPSILRAARADGDSDTGIKRPALDVVENTILNLDNDHSFFMRELGEAVKKVFYMRENSGADDREQLSHLREKFARFRVRMEAHNEVEESLVYLWGESLRPEDLPRLSSKIQKELQNLPPRFHGIVDESTSAKI